MKCPKCAAMCMAGDTVCFGCKTPLGVSWKPAGGGSAQGSGSSRTPVPQRISMIFMWLGAAIMPVVMGHETWAPKQTIDWGAANWAGIGGAVGATFGLLVGQLFAGKKL